MIGLAGGTTLLAIWLGVWIKPNTDSHVRAGSRRLHAEAISAWEAEDPDPGLSLLIQSIRTDSTDVAGFVDLLLFGPAGGWDRLLPEARAFAVELAERTSPDHPLHQCAKVLAYGMEHFPVGPSPSEPVDSPCNLLTRWTAHQYEFSDSEIGRLQLAAWRQLPESAALPILAAASFAGDVEETVAIARSMAESPYRLVRVIGATREAKVAHTAGDHQRALALENMAEHEARAGGPRVNALRILNDAPLHAGLREIPNVSVDVAAHVFTLSGANDTVGELLATNLDPWFRWGSLIDRGRNALNQGNLRLSLDRLSRAVELSDSLKDQVNGVQARLLLGRAAVKAGNPELARRTLLAARAQLGDSMSVRLAYEVDHNLLHLYESAGEWYEARNAGARFVEETEAAILSPVRMMAHHDMGWFLRRRGEWEPAQRHFTRMVNLVDSLTRPGSEAPFYAGEYFESVGEFDQALSYYRLAYDRDASPRSLEAMSRIAELTGDTVGAIAAAKQFDALGPIAYPEQRPLLPGVLARTGKWKEAMRWFEQARADAEQHGRVAGWARLSIELALLSLNHGDFDRATLLSDSATVAASQVGDREQAVLGSAVGAAAEARLGMGIADALQRLRRASNAARTMQAPTLEHDVALLEGEALLRIGKLKEALSVLRRVQALTDEMAIGLENDPTRAGFRATQLAPSNRAFEGIVAMAGPDEAPRLWAEWSRLRKGRDLGTEDQTWNLRSVPEDLAVVDYVLLDSLVAALVVTRRTVGVQVLPIRPTEVRVALDRLSATVSPRVGTRVDTARARLDSEVLQSLAAGLLTPIADLLDKHSRLVLVPDGPLHRVPFDALPTFDPSRRVVPAVSRWTIALAPTLGVALRPSKDRREGYRLLVVGDGGGPGGPVPGAVRELESVQRAAGDGVVIVLQGARAEEVEVERAVAKAGVVHFVTHARPNYRSPDLAEVLLTAGSGRDGRLQAHEIRNLSLRGALVVLSACETVAGREAGGEGALSLSRAFLQAGAAQVVATLWPVGEAAAGLMGAFHKGLAAGLRPVEALRMAKLEALERGDTPLGWASFTVLLGGR